jgi:hypothetical protein
VVYNLESENLAMMRLICLVSLCTLAFGPAGCKNKTAKPPAEPAKPEVTVKAGDLLKEYNGNALAADSKYKGKLIQVQGKFAKASKAPLLGYAVTLVPDDGDLDLAGVQCFIVEAAEAEVAKIQPGTMITMVGTCDGQVLGQVKVSKCYLVK